MDNEINLLYHRNSHPHVIQTFGQACLIHLCGHLEYFDLAARPHLSAHQPVEGRQADVLNLQYQIY